MWLREAYPGVPVTRLSLAAGADAWRGALPTLLAATVLITPHGPLARSTVPFLPIGAAAIVTDYPQTPPAGVTLRQVGEGLGDEDAAADRELGGGGGDGGAAVYRSVSPDAALLDHLPAVRVLSYQTRAQEDLAAERGQRGDSKEAGTEDMRTVPVQLRRRKLLQLVQWAVEGWAAAADAGGTSGEASDVGRLYPRYGENLAA
jgi:hypothetical protein